MTFSFKCPLQYTKIIFFAICPQIRPSQCILEGGVLFSLFSNSNYIMLVLFIVNFAILMRFPHPGELLLFMVHFYIPTLNNVLSLNNITSTQSLQHNSYCINVRTEYLFLIPAFCFLYSHQSIREHLFLCHNCLGVIYEVCYRTCFESPSDIKKRKIPEAASCYQQLTTCHPKARECSGLFFAKCE